jgi:hypothetical protein
MGYDRLIFRVHAIQRMFQNGISEADVRHVLQSGEVIEDYPTDKPYPSRLVLGWRGSRPLHVVAADNRDEQVTIVITTYEPDPGRWEPGLKKRRKA